MLDLWAREHYKSTIITYAKTIQDILASHGDNPLEEWEGVEPSFGIFSHTRPIAKGFLRQIKREFESNELLKTTFPDVLYENPGKDAPKWSEDDGIVVKRKSNPKESTVEAWGVVDGQPTGKHFFVRIYDDVVTRESVRTPQGIRNTLEALELSYNLGVDGGHARFIGTRYHFNDAYGVIEKRGTAKVRLYPATQNGLPDGEPTFLSQEALVKKRRDMGPYVFACQMLQNPKADETEGFSLGWLQHYRQLPEIGTGNRYILVDPASAKKKDSDYTAMWVLELREDQNYYAVDMVRDRLNLTERAQRLFDLHRKWRPLKVGYERYGMQADIEHIKDRQEREGYRFPIVELGGSTPKADRIKRLIPLFEQGRMYLPESHPATQYDGRNVDLVEQFVNEEYLAFPVGHHDDSLDSLARILDADLNAQFPMEYQIQTESQPSGFVF